PAHELDHGRDCKGDPEAEDDALPRLLLELLAADVAQHRRVHGPHPSGDEVVPEEPVPGKPLRVARRERDGGAAEGDEPRDEDDVAPPLRELTLGPVEALVGLLALEEPFPRPLARELAYPVGDVVADDGSGPGGEDDEEDVEPLARAGDRAAEN